MAVAAHCGRNLGHNAEAAHGGLASLTTFFALDETAKGDGGVI